MYHIHFITTDNSLEKEVTRGHKNILLDLHEVYQVRKFDESRAARLYRGRNNRNFQWMSCVIRWIWL